MGEVNYIVATPDRKRARKLCHINMLKPYFNRDSSIPSAVAGDVALVCNGEEGNSSEATADMTAEGRV